MPDESLKPLFDEARRLYEPKLLQITHPEPDNAVPEQVLVAVLPAGLTLQSVKPLFDAYRAAPERRIGTAKLDELDSFIAHVKRFADEDSAIFADQNDEAPKLTAVLDYHRKDAEGDPRFGQHRAEYAFPLSDEWEKWTEKNGAQMSQADFAEFVEARIADAIDPANAGEGARVLETKLGISYASPARLLELSRGLTISVGRRVQQVVNTGTGEAKIAFAEDHTDPTSGAPLKVPGGFVIGIPVFRGGAPYEIPVRLRYRAAGSSVVWFLELYRTDVVFRHAFREAAEKARTETNLPLFFGAPEV